MIEWNGLDEQGFAPFCRTFMRNYRLLNITMEEAMLVMHLLDHSWLGEQDFPSVRFFAEQTGKHESTIRLYFKSLSHKGYLLEVTGPNNAKTYDWSPLLSAMKDIVGVPPRKEPKAVANEVDQPSLGSLLSATASLVTGDVKPDVKPKKAKKPTARHANRLKKFSEKSASEYNANDMEIVMAQAWTLKGWRSAAPKFTLRDRKHAKDLIEQHGPETVASVIEEAISKWEDVAPKMRLNNTYPSMSIIFGYRNSIFPLLIDGELNMKPTWGSQFDREKDASPTDGGGSVGW